MNLIDLYVEAVIKFLPQENKAEAARTLRSQIAEKLPPNPSDEEVRRVLEELGNPRQQAKTSTPAKDTSSALNITTAISPS